MHDEGDWGKETGDNVRAPAFPIYRLINCLACPFDRLSPVPLPLLLSPLSPMAFLGRDSQADLQRVERFKAWTSARTPYAIISAAAGLLSIVDFWTMVLGVIAGIAAIALGFRGLRDLREKPRLLGYRLCITGIVLGSIGLVLSLAMWVGVTYG